MRMVKRGRKCLRGRRRRLLGRWASIRSPRTISGARRPRGSMPSRSSTCWWRWWRSRPSMPVPWRWRRSDMRPWAKFGIPGRRYFRKSDADASRARLRREVPRDSAPSGLSRLYARPPSPRAAMLQAQPPAGHGTSRRHRPVHGWQRRLPSADRAESVGLVRPGDPPAE